MKCKRHFKKLLSTSLAVALCASMLMQGTLTVAAEEPLDSENAVNLENSTQDSEDNVGTGSDQKKEDASVTEGTTSETEEDSTEDEASGENVPIEAPDEGKDQDEVKQEETADDADNLVSEDELETEGVLEDASLEETTAEMELLEDSEDTEPLALDYIGVSELGWDGNGVGMFKINDSEPAFYTVQLYKDGAPTIKVRYGDLSSSVGRTIEWDFKTDINESGNYTFKVKISKDDSGDIWDFSTGQVSESSPVFEYIKPAEKLSTPTGLQWENEKKGVAAWNPVENAERYYVILCRDNKSIYGVTGFDTQKDFSDQIGGEGNYTFRVQAISSDVTKYANSDWSEDSVPLGDSESVKETLKDIIDNENVSEAINDLKDEEKVSKSELQIAMQTDNYVQERIQELEKKYMQDSGVSVAEPSVEDVAIDAAKIKMLGAALNAAPGQNVALRISKPANESPYNPTVYKNMIQFSMDMYIDNNAVTELAIPVTITLPVPSGMNIDRLDILHYTSEGNYETIHPRKNGDGTVSFTITHFSIFAFAETAEESGGASEQIREDGETVSREDGSSEQSDDSTSTQVQEWKPTTPDEIKRYACKGKEAIDYTLSKENSYPVVIMNAMQGPMCFSSFEAILGDYTIGRTYNIYPAKNLTYSMEQEVELTIKIPASVYKADREYKMICVTKGGQPFILDDLDKNSETITFKTNKFYAFALIYK